MPLLKVFIQLLIIPETIRLLQIFTFVNFFAQELHNPKMLTVTVEISVNKLNTNHNSFFLFLIWEISPPKLLA